MLRPAYEGWEIAFGEIIAGEPCADCARSVIQDYGGVVEEVGHGELWREGARCGCLAGLLELRARLELRGLVALMRSSVESRSAICLGNRKRRVEAFGRCLLLVCDLLLLERFASAKISGTRWLIELQGSLIRRLLGISVLNLISSTTASGHIQCEEQINVA